MNVTVNAVMAEALGKPKSLSPPLPFTPSEKKKTLLAAKKRSDRNGRKAALTLVLPPTAGDSSQRVKKG